MSIVPTEAPDLETDGATLATWLEYEYTPFVRGDRADYVNYEVWRAARSAEVA